MQLFELNNKFILRSYTEHANRINSLSFAPNNRNFASAANETSIKYWDITETGSSPVLTFQQAHSDNIKKVVVLPDSNHILSASQDRTIKLWDLRNNSQAVSSLTVANAVEDLCVVNDQIVVAHGNTLTLAGMPSTGDGFQLSD